MRGPHNTVLGKFDQWVENRAVKALMKYARVPTSDHHGVAQGTEPPYRREFDPRWIYRVRRNSALVNNSIEEKVNQTFRRGWAEWEERYEAKCPACDEEFGSETPFIEDYHPEDVEIDFDSERSCPECGEMVEMKTPDPDELERAKEFFAEANGATLPDSHLEPDDTGSVGQTLLEVLREISWDLESFDDEWLTINRKYQLDSTGKVISYEPVEVFRAPPEQMQYVRNADTGAFGGQYWVCIECRSKNGGENYSPETQNQRCSQCGNHTHEAFAVAVESGRGGDPLRYYIRGEFVHRSEYEPSQYYGFSPIVSLWEEARTLEQMDKWYQTAYEKRRAPRGAIAIKSSNAKSTREWNKKQFEKMDDPNHIPTLMDDGESDGEPIKFINLLESPAEMQHMEMREWMKERISAKWGVTPIFQGSPSESGLSQSMEIQVSNRAADRLRTIQNDVVDVLLKQLGIDGWTVGIAPVEEENESHEAELQLKHLQILQQAVTMGLDAEWTEEDRSHVKPGPAEEPEGGGEGMGMGGMDGLGELGSEGEETAADQGGPEQQDDVQTATEAAGGDRVDLGAPGSGGADGGMSP